MTVFSICRTYIMTGMIVATLYSNSRSDPLTFTLIADDKLHGTYIEKNVPASLADNGTVVFRGLDTLSSDALFSGNGLTNPVMVDLGDTGWINFLSSYDDIHSPQVISSGEIVFIAKRSILHVALGVVQFQGIYRAMLGGSGSDTLFEGGPLGHHPVPRHNVAMAETGLVAFSTIANGNGAIYSGSVAGTPAVLRNGSGTFFNTLGIDINDAGLVPIQMEYSDSTIGLSRGILIFENPGDDLTTINTAIEKLNVGSQPQPVINNHDQVAFSLNNSVTLPLFLTTFNAGIYKANPTAFDVAPDLTMIVGTDGPFDSFGRVEMDDFGNIVFEATLDNNVSGIYGGPDPLLDRIIQEGDQIDGNTVLDIRLGELNNSGQVAFITTDTSLIDRVYRVQGGPIVIPAPATVWIGLALGVGMLTRRIRP